MPTTTGDIQDLAAQDPDVTLNPFKAATNDMNSMIAESVGDSIVFLSTMWTRVPTPRLSEALWDSFKDHMIVYLTGFAVLSIAVCAAQLCFSRDGEPARRIAKFLPLLGFVMGSAAPVISMFAMLSDSMTYDIIEWGTVDNFGDELTRLFGLGTGGDWALNFFLGLLVGIFATPLGLIIGGILIVRYILIIFYSFVLMFAVCFYPTEFGRQLFWKSVAWILGLMAFKPAAAVLFAVAFKLSSGAATLPLTENAPEVVGDLLNTVFGLLTFFMVVFLFKGLMNIVDVAPAVRITGNGGGSFTGSALGVVASGAVSNGLGGGPGVFSTPEPPSSYSAPSGAANDGGSSGSFAPVSSPQGATNNSTSSISSTALAASSPAGAATAGTVHLAATGIETVNSATDQAVGAVKN